MTMTIKTFLYFGVEDARILTEEAERNGSLSTRRLSELHCMMPSTMLEKC